MTFNPAVHPLLLLAIAALFIGFAVWRLMKADSRSSLLLWIGRAIALVACIALLARPGIPGGQSTTLATDVDVFLVVDTTASIAAEDWDGDRPRLDGVRQDVSEIMATYPGARFSLITFDQNAQIRLPLTTDTSAVRTSLEILTPEVTANSSGSDIGVAADSVRDSLARAAEAAPDRSRMVFYFGDGEQTAAGDPIQFSDMEDLVSGGVVFGYGTEAGGPMKITDGRFEESDEYIEYEGRNAMSIPDEANLTAIADDLGIELQWRSADEEIVLPEVPASEYIDEDNDVKNVTELYWIFALVIAAWLAFELARSTALLVQLRSETRGVRRGN